MTRSSSMLTITILPILLLFASYTDMKMRIISNNLCLAIALCALPFITWNNVFGLIAVLPLLLVAVSSDGIGGGDIKLTGALGFALGYQYVVITLVAGLSMMLIFHAVLTVIKKINQKPVGNTYPMAPFVGVGYCIVLLLKIV